MISLRRNEQSNEVWNGPIGFPSTADAAYFSVPTFDECYQNSLRSHCTQTCLSHETSNQLSPNDFYNINSKRKPNQLNTKIVCIKLEFTRSGNCRVNPVTINIMHIRMTSCDIPSIHSLPAPLNPSTEHAYIAHMNHIRIDTECEPWDLARTIVVVSAIKVNKLCFRTIFKYYKGRIDWISTILLI